MQPSPTYDRFIQALNVMNAALELHRHSPFFQNWLPFAETCLGRSNLVIAILENADALVPHDYFTIRLQDGSFVVVSHGKTGNNIVWRVSERYLGELVSDPRRFLDSPEQLDFDWLKLHAGVSLLARSPIDTVGI